MINPDWVEFAVSFGRRITLRASLVVAVDTLIDPSGESDKERAAISYKIDGVVHTFRVEEFYEDVTAALKAIVPANPMYCARCRRGMVHGMDGV